MKKALILLLAFVMVVSAGMGFGAAATTPDAQDQTIQSSQQHDNNIGDNNNKGKEEKNSKDNKKFKDKCDQCVNCKENGCDHCDKCKEEIKKEATVIVIQKTIIYKEVLLAAGAFGGAGGAGGASGAGAANKNAAGGKTVPMQKTGLPILPGILSTLMIGSGLLYGRLRN